MGLRADLDKRKQRYVYFLTDQENNVLYVGTSTNPKQRYKTHLKRATTENALFYRYVRKHKIQLKLHVVCSITSTYAEAEKLEISYIEKHQATCLNFYNNPNKERLEKIEQSLN